MKNLLYLIMPFLLQSCQGQEKHICCELNLKGKARIDDLSKEYRRLKKDHSSIWDCCGNSGSGLRKVMIMLDDSISIGTTEKRIIEIMGQPDSIQSTSFYNIKIEESETMMIYMWRETHDFLYFIIKNGTLDRKKWYYALE